MEETTADVLVVGSGIAGLYTALQLAGRRRVLLVTAQALDVGNTPLAQGGIAAALAADDTAALHLADTLAAGAGHSDETAADVLVREGPACVEHLHRLGIPFAQAAGGFALTREAAHGRRRVAFVEDRTGLAVHQGLTQAVLADGRITVRTGCRLVQLVTDGTRCSGGWLEDTAGRRVLVRAAHTVLATGGFAGLYRRTTNSPAASGSGVALAYAAGAALTDLEFVQFHPTALWHRGRVTALISEALRGEGAVLRNEAGDRFMTEIDSRAELAPRDIVARAVHAQLQTAGSEHIWLDARPLGTAMYERFPAVTAACREAGIDPANELIPIVPAAHYTMGGVYTDTQGCTTLPGLLAVGEVACTGVHGANRLASNSLLEGLVFGSRAAQWLADQPAAPPPTVRHTPPPTPLRLAATATKTEADVGTLLDQAAGLVRTGDGLLAAERELARLQTESSHAVMLARLIIGAARQRTESRGAHYRSDCPEASPAWAGRRLFHRVYSEREVTA